MLRLPQRNRLRDLKSKVRCEYWKPPMLSLHLRCIRLGARQAHEKLLSEAKRPVVPSLLGNAMNAEVSPAWKLAGQQAPCQRLVDQWLEFFHAGMRNCTFLEPSKKRHRAKNAYSFTDPVSPDT
jgi:hypothetical protein